MSNLEQLLQDIADKRAESKINPEDADPRVRAGVEAMVRNAASAVASLETQYKNEVIKSVILVGVQGDYDKDFAEMAQDKFNAMILDFKQIKIQIMTTLESRHSGPTYTSNVHFMMLDELSRTRTRYDMVRLPSPVISGYNDGIYDAPLSQAIDILFEKNYGASLYSAVTRREIGEKALVKFFKDPLLPVLVYNFDGKVDTDLLPNPVTTIMADEKVTLKSVKESLDEVKDLVTNKTSNKTRSKKTANGGQSNE